MIFEEIAKIESVAIKKRMLKLDLLNKAKIKVEEEGYEKEYDTLKTEYDNNSLQVYTQMGQIIKGSEGVKGIPDYWATVIKNSGFFAENQKDDEILSQLVDTRMVLNITSDNLANFRVEFEFNTNQWFDETVLSKTYFFKPNTDEIEKTETVKPTWKSKELNPTLKIVTKKIKKGKTSHAKTTEKKVPSFFDLFDVEEPKEEAEMMDMTSSQEAGFFKEEFFANSLEFYLDLLDDEDDFDDECDEDDESDDGEGEPEDKKKKKKGGDKEKCKNQ